MRLSIGKRVILCFGALPLPLPSSHAQASAAPFHHFGKAEGNDGRWHCPKSNQAKHTQCNQPPHLLTLFKIVTLMVFLTFSLLAPWNGSGTCPLAGPAYTWCLGCSLQGLLAHVPSP